MSAILGPSLDNERTASIDTAGPSQCLSVTLRQVPTVVGKVSTGDPVFEVRGVLMLRPGATHFNRAISCSKCGRDVAGGAVLSPADLDLTPNPVICKNRVRTAGTELFAAEDRPPLGPPAQAPDAPAASAPETEPEPAAPADEDRLAALERGLADLATLITSAPTQRRQAANMPVRAAGTGWRSAFSLEAPGDAGSGPTQSHGATPDPGGRPL